MTEITALIRYKDSANNLPEVLTALSSQSLRPSCILGVDTGSSDGSTALLEAAGAKIVRWHNPYHHSKVLNFGISHCDTPIVLCLSSHTVMQEQHLLESLAADMEDQKVCASSIKWDDDPYYSDCINWEEMVQKGIKFGSIYSNSLGLFRRTLWEDYPFDENLNGMEDYDWALHHLKSGHCVIRRQLDMSYQRNAHNRDMPNAAKTFYLANRYNLSVKWIGYKGALTAMLKHLPGHLAGNKTATATFETCRRRLTGALFWRHFNLNKDA